MIETSEATRTSAVAEFAAELQTRIGAIRGAITDLAAFAGQIPAPQSEADVQAVLGLRRQGSLPGYEVGRQQHDDGARRLLDNVRADLDALANAVAGMYYSAEPHLRRHAVDGTGGLLNTAEPGLTFTYMFDMAGDAIWRFDPSRTAWDSKWRSMGSDCSIYAPRVGQFDPSPPPPPWVETDIIRRGLTKEEQMEKAVREAEAAAEAAKLTRRAPDPAWFTDPPSMWPKSRCVDTFHGFFRERSGIPWERISTGETEWEAEQKARAHVNGRAGQILVLSEAASRHTSSYPK